MIQDVRAKIAPILENEGNLRKILKFVTAQTNKDELNQEFNNKIERLMYRINLVQENQDRETDQISKRISLLENASSSLRQEMLAMKTPDFMLKEAAKKYQSMMPQHNEVRNSSDSSEMALKLQEALSKINSKD